MATARSLGTPSPRGSAGPGPVVTLANLPPRWPPVLPRHAGVRVVQLLSWQQRLSALASQRALVAALLAAVRVCQAAAGPRGQPAPQAAWPAEGRGAQLEEARRQLLTILCAWVDQRLAAEGDQAAGAGGVEAPGDGRVTAPGGGKGGTAAAARDGGATAQQGGAAALQQLADAAISCCLLAGQADALWSTLFPRFQRHPPAAAAFLQQLLPAILSDWLPRMAPEVGGVGRVRVRGGGLARVAPHGPGHCG